VLERRLRNVAHAITAGAFFDFEIYRESRSWLTRPLRTGDLARRGIPVLASKGLLPPLHQGRLEPMTLNDTISPPLLEDRHVPL
jgi:hypothetical protein